MTEVWPVVLGMALLGLTIAALVLRCLQQSGGRFLYPADDPYIHMAMAKNFAQHGVWGITRYEFSGSSSSPLWTLLLALTYAIFGANEVSPLALNIIFAVLLVFGAYALLRRQAAPQLFSSLVLFGLIFCVPLAAFSLLGQEHVLFALLALLFAHHSASSLSAKSDSSRTSHYRWALALTPLLAASRYEGLLLVSAVCLLLLLRRRGRDCFALAALAAIPVGIYGAVLSAHGWSWLPSPVLLKAKLPGLASAGGVYELLGGTVRRQLAATPHVLVLVISALMLFAVRGFKKGSFWERRQVLVVIFVATTLLHMQFGRAGLVSRYDAYLIVLGVFAVSLQLLELPGERRARGARKASGISGAAPVLFLLIPVLPLAGVRGVGMLVLGPVVTRNIYDQHFQVARFLGEFYQGRSVAANDVGLINYFSDLRNLDLWGLGTWEVAKARLGGRYGTKEIYELTARKKVKVAVVSDSWLELCGGAPQQWIKVGEWRNPRNRIWNIPPVSWYAVDPSLERPLTRRLREFSPRLPKEVMQIGKYVQEFPR